MTEFNADHIIYQTCCANRGTNERRNVLVLVLVL